MSFVRFYSVALTTSLICVFYGIFADIEIELVFTAVLSMSVWTVSAWVAWRIQERVLKESGIERKTNAQVKRLVENYLTEIKVSSNRRLASIDEDLVQIKSVISEAAVSMQQSFEHVNNLSSEQNTLVTSLMSELSSTTDDADHGQVNFKKFVAETDRVLEYFVNYLLTTSKQSIEMVEVVNDVGQYMEKIEKLLSDVQQIADQTNLLALNAAIEAARAGEAGRGFAVVADEVRELSKHSDRFSEQIRDVINASRTNIDQAKAMIETMASKDMNFAIQSKANVDLMMKGIENLNEHLSEKLNEMSSSSHEIDGNVGTALGALHFQEVAHHLVGIVQSNIAECDKLMNQATQVINGIPSEGIDDWVKEVEAHIDNLNNTPQLSAQ